MDKNEYREDFEAVINNYRQWIDKYINSLRNTKINNIKEKLDKTMEEWMELSE